MSGLVEAFAKLAASRRGAHAIALCSYVECRRALPTNARPGRLYCNQTCRKAQWLLDHPDGVAVAGERPRTVRVTPRLSHTVMRVDGEWVVVRWVGTVVERVGARQEARDRAQELRST